MPVSQGKSPGKSRTETQIIARPSDANTLGIVFGGRLLEWMDMAAAICARRHTGTRINTVAVYQVKFHRAVTVGQVVRIRASVTRSFASSLEVLIELYSENSYQQNEFLAAHGYFVMVGVNDSNRPIAIPELVPETEPEKELWQQAKERKIFYKRD